MSKICDDCIHLAVCIKNIELEAPIIDCSYKKSEAQPAPDLREAMLANALLSSVYTYDGHLKGRDVVFCDHCNAEPVDKLEGTLVHDARCPIKLATDILTTPAQPEKELDK